ncbi:MAG: AraC family transcriptional regulator [Saprospiraceae bacterium]|nr:AraC family transcriptional regulator [Saprospiraceae bacterium]
MLNLLNAITAGSAVFLAFLVVTVRRDANAAANRWLGVFMLLVGLFMLDDSLVVFGIYRQYPQMVGVLNLPIFALSPSLYMVVSHFVAAERRFRRRDIWHFVPFLLFLLLSLPFLLSSNKVKLEELDTLGEPMTLADKIFLAIIVLQMVAYLFFSFRKLRRYRRNLDNITASPDSVSLNWLRYFLWGVLGMVAIWFVELFFIPTLASDAGWYSPAYSFGVYALGYFALRQKEVFPYSKMEAEAINEILQDNETMPTARKQLFSEEKLNLLKISLLKKMETERPYLDPELNLPSLAHQMNLSVHEMSELINMGFGENFAQFVNRHRVEESKKLLFSEKHAHLSMVGIAFEAGFNSKTAFNMAFKKMTGVSPTEFREKGGKM